MPLFDALAFHSPQRIEIVRRPVFLYGATFVWLMVIGLAGWCSLRGDATPSAASTAAAGSPATLVLRHTENGPITVSGVVPDVLTRERVLAELRDAWPTSEWGADFAIDPAIARPMWLAGLKSLLPLVRGTAGAEIRLAGNEIALGGALSQTERTRLRAQIGLIFDRQVTDVTDISEATAGRD